YQDVSRAVAPHERLPRMPMPTAPGTYAVLDRRADPLLEKRFHLIQSANLLVTIPRSNDRLVVRQLDVAEVVQALAPAPSPPGPGSPRAPSGRARPGRRPCRHADPSPDPPRSRSGDHAEITAGAGRRAQAPNPGLQSRPTQAGNTRGPSPALHLGIGPVSGDRGPGVVGDERRWCTPFEQGDPDHDRRACSRSRRETLALGRPPGHLDRPAGARDSSGPQRMENLQRL